jgi:UDP-galactopyranose mutase
VSYDFIIVGAGLFGSVFTAEATAAGKRVLVLDKRSHAGGFCDSYQDQTTGIEVHRYGTHVFHTDNVRVWEWMHKHTQFYPYRHRVMAQAVDGRVFELPVNLDTFERFAAQRITPAEAARMLPSPTSNNFETTAIERVGPVIYKALFEGYTRKQWGCDPAELPASIAMRLPVYTSYRSGYFGDRHQGVPEDGYGRMFQAMLSGADVQLGLTVNLDMLDDLRANCETLVWTGPIDGFYGYDMGRLGWRSVKLHTEVLREDDHQGCAQMNYASVDIPWTRKHEPKHFRPDRWVPDQTVVLTEYPGDDQDDPAYPMRRPADLRLFASYKARADKERGVIFGGRLASYAYYDMHQVVAQALRQSSA